MSPERQEESRRTTRAAVDRHLAGRVAQAGAAGPHPGQELDKTLSHISINPDRRLRMNDSPSKGVWPPAAEQGRDRE